MKRMRVSARFRIYREVRRAMSERYPEAFPRHGKRPPLKVGIFKDIVADAAHGLPPGKVRVFLSVWTSSTAYLASVSRRGERLALDGTPCGAVMRSHASEASEAVRKRKGGAGFDKGGRVI